MDATFAHRGLCVLGSGCPRVDVGDDVDGDPGGNVGGGHLAPSPAGHADA